MNFIFCIFYLQYLLITTTFLHILPRESAHYNFIFAYFTSSICSLHPRVIFIKGNDNFNVTFWKKTAFQWLFYSRPSNFTRFLVEGTRTFLEPPFSLFCDFFYWFATDCTSFLGAGRRTYLPETALFLLTYFIVFSRV